MIMASRTKIIIAVLVLLVASKLQVGADHVDAKKEDQNTVSGIAQASTSIGSRVTPSDPVQPVQRLRGDKHRRLRGGNDSSNTNNDGMARALQNDADVYDNNSAADEWPEYDNDAMARALQNDADMYDNNSAADEWPEYDNNFTADEWPDDMNNFDSNSTATESEVGGIESLSPFARVLVYIFQVCVALCLLCCLCQACNQHTEVWEVRRIS